MMRVDWRIVFLLALIACGCRATWAQTAQPPAAKGQKPRGNDRLKLVDVPAYLAALSGRPTNDAADPSEAARKVTFRELWNESAKFEGHRVKIQGRVERIFRQAAVGSLPPLAEAWVFNPAGEPFCVVFPIESAEAREPGVVAHRNASRGLEKGSIVEFTGTFLRLVQYAASKGPRLAPLIVGDRTPEPRVANTQDAKTTKLAPGSPEVFRAIGGGVSADSSANLDRLTGSTAKWVLAGIIAALAAILLARQHMSRPIVRNRERDVEGLFTPDPPLEFVTRDVPPSVQKPSLNGHSPH